MTIELPDEEKILPHIHKSLENLIGHAEAAWTVATGLIEESDKIGVGNSLTMNWCLAAVFVKTTPPFCGNISVIKGWPRY